MENILESFVNITTESSSKKVDIYGNITLHTARDIMFSLIPAGQWNLQTDSFDNICEGQ